MSENDQPTWLVEPRRQALIESTVIHEKLVEAIDPLAPGEEIMSIDPKTTRWLLGDDQPKLNFIPKAAVVITDWIEEAGKLKCSQMETVVRGQSDRTWRFRFTFSSPGHPEPSSELPFRSNPIGSLNEPRIISRGYQGEFDRFINFTSELALRNSPHIRNRFNDHANKLSA